MRWPRSACLGSVLIIGRRAALGRCLPVFLLPPVTAAAAAFARMFVKARFARWPVELRPLALRLGMRWAWWARLMRRSRATRGSLIGSRRHLGRAPDRGGHGCAFGRAGRARGRVGRTRFRRRWHLRARPLRARWPVIGPRARRWRRRRSLRHHPDSRFFRHFARHLLRWWWRGGHGFGGRGAPCRRGGGFDRRGGGLRPFGRRLFGWGLLGGDFFARPLFGGGGVGGFEGIAHVV